MKGDVGEFLMKGKSMSGEKRNCLKGFVCIQFCIQSQAGLIVRKAKEHLQNDNEQINDCNLLFPAYNLRLFLPLTLHKTVLDSIRMKSLTSFMLGPMVHLISCCTGSALHLLHINLFKFPVMS